PIPRATICIADLNPVPVILYLSMIAIAPTTAIIEPTTAVKLVDISLPSIVDRSSRAPVNTPIDMAMVSRAFAFTDIANEFRALLTPSSTSPAPSTISPHPVNIFRMSQATLANIPNIVTIPATKPPAIISVPVNPPKYPPIAVPKLLTLLPIQVNPDFIPPKNLSKKFADLSRESLSDPKWSTTPVIASLTLNIQLTIFESSFHGPLPVNVPFAKMFHTSARASPRLDNSLIVNLAPTTIPANVAFRISIAVVNAVPSFRDWLNAIDKSATLVSRPRIPVPVILIPSGKTDQSA